MRALLFLLALPIFGAVEGLTVTGVTPTQAVLMFTAPTDSACSVEVSTSPTFATLVADVDSSLFPNADLDSRDPLLPTGRQRIFVVGRQGPTAIDTAANGYRLSRALQAAKGHYARANCSGDISPTVHFTTANIQTGDTRGEALATSSDAPFEYLQVTANAVVLPEFADPYTGTLIKRPLENRVYGYLGATTSGADCNKTLTGIGPACLFDEAIGAGWTATTGTLTDAVRGDDSNFAQYSGTTQQPLLVRLSIPGKYPTSSTPEQVGGLSSQMFAVKMLTNDDTGDGGLADICVVSVDEPNNCISPLRVLTLTTAETIITICKDAPCATPDEPGDIVLDKFPAEYYMYPNTRVYNTAGSLPIWKFTGSGAQSTCDNLPVNTTIVANDTRTYAIRDVVVVSKDCGNTPPQVTVDPVNAAISEYDLTHTGTTGVTLWRVSRYSLSRSIALRVRKVSTTSGSTISLGYVLWRGVVNTPFSYAIGSGGFGKTCQITPLPSGEYLCLFNKHIVGVSYGPEGMVLKNYGFTYFNGSFLGAGFESRGYYNCPGEASDTMWSDTEPGVFYCRIRTTYPNPYKSGAVDNRDALIKFTLDTSAEKAAGVVTAGGEPGLGGKAQRMTFTSMVNLTPCLNSCASVDDDFTIFGQLKKYMPTWDHTLFPNISIQSVQGNLINGLVRAGSQDSPAMTFTMDLGNGLPINGGYVGSYGNTQHVFAGFVMPEAYNSRWCGEHTFQAPIEPGGAGFVVIEGGDKCPMSVTVTTALSTCSIGEPGTCGACPAVTLDGFDYTGKNWCANIDLTSSWNGGWGATPSAFEVGDPVSSGCPTIADNLHYWGQKLQTGDIIFRNNEFMRILRRNTNLNFDVIRGWGGYPGASSSADTWVPKSHTGGSSFGTRCGARGRNPTSTNPELPQGISWFPALDPNGDDSNYTFISSKQNHALHGSGVAASPEYNVQRYTSDPATLRTNPSAVLRLPERFAGIDSPSCAGNACEKHPSYGQVAGDTNAKAAFADVHPRLFKASTGPTAASLVGGYNFTYVWNSTPNWRHFGIEIYTGLAPLRFVNSITPDDPADVGKACLSHIADACFSGSLANKIYAVLESLDNTFIAGGLSNTCKEGEFGTTQGDWCAHNSSGISASITQWRIPTPAAPADRFLNGTAQRAVVKFARTYRESATENVKQDPRGKTLLARSNYYVWPPPFPEKPSSVDRSTWAFIPVSIPTVVAGTSTAVVEFGYDSSLHCNSSRAAVCIAETATYNTATPYLLEGETVTGLSCSSGCTVLVPARHSNVLHYRIKLRDAGGATIWTGPTQVQVAN